MSARSTAVLFDQIFGGHVRELIAEERALKLAEDEFKLGASVKGALLVTTRNRRRRLVHAQARAVSVWRRTEAGGPQLARIAARTLCGQWIRFAQRWQRQFLDGEWCPSCLRALEAAGFELPKVEVDF